MSDAVTKADVKQEDAVASAQEGRGLLVRLRGGPSWRGFFLHYAMVWVLILLALFASTIYSGFFSGDNLNTMIAQVASTGVVAVGMTYAVICGLFDLSVGAIFAGASVAYAALANHMPLFAAFILTLLLGVACGIINGLVVTKLRVNAFIATLATASLFSGATYLYDSSGPVLTNAPGFQTLGTGQFGGIWISSYLLLAFILIFGVVLNRTPYGRSLYAVGGNMEAARLAGMRVDVIRTSTFVATGLCAAVGGMLVASQTGVGQANIGSTVTLNSIAIVIIGGTSLLGGEGAMWRTVVGILIWGTLDNIFAAKALDTASQLLIQAAIVIVAVSIDSLARLARR
jgi:ribose transport system permease protein